MQVDNTIWTINRHASAFDLIRKLYKCMSWTLRLPMAAIAISHINRIFPFRQAAICHHLTSRLFHSISRPQLRCSCSFASCRKCCTCICIESCFGSIPIEIENSIRESRFIQLANWQWFAGKKKFTDLVLKFLNCRAKRMTLKKLSKMSGVNNGFFV